MLFYGRQSINRSDIQAVNKVLNSMFITQGPKVQEFENAFSLSVGSNYSVTFNSATSGLHSACLALGVSKGDLVWTTPISFVASATCAISCGAHVDFVDIDPSSFNMCTEKLEQKLKQAQKQNEIPKVVIPVHMCGQSCDMEKIYDLSLQYGFKVIEDASHATGASYKNQKVGSCKYSDLSIFSFHPVKLITSGEGGMVTTNSPELERKLKALRSHGITKNPSEFINSVSAEEPWYYEQQSLGFNYRMSDLQAALGLNQLGRLEHFIKARNNIAHRYNRLFKLNGAIRTPIIQKNCISSFHLYVIQLKLSDLNEKKHLFKYFSEKGIILQVHYIPIHLQPFFCKLGFKKGDFPNAEKYYSEAISIPIFPDLTETEIDYVVDLFSRVQL